MFKILSLLVGISLCIAEPLNLPGRKFGRPQSYSGLVKNHTQWIVGGGDAVAGANPHQCSLRRSSHSCGASIISTNWVITAAHCIDGASPSSLSLRCGTEYHATPGIDFKITKLIPHPQYDSWKLDYDLGLILISGTFNLGSNNINKIALPEQNELIPSGSEVTVTGWGALTEGGYLPDVLQTVNVPVVTNDVCSQKYEGFNDITDRMFCAGVDAGGVDSCQGDSGGPVTSNGKLVGAVSWGYGCARPNYPGVYTRIASLRDWVKQETTV